jgi:single-stranded-DNA-specific exonuclease
MWRAAKTLWISPMAADAAFLGVAQSISGKRWSAREAADGAAAEIARIAQVPDIVGRLLAGRGVAAAEAARYLKPTLKQDLPDPSVLANMDRAAVRIADAVERGEGIAIFGDYDVDGAASSALLKRYLRAVGCDARVYIPDRMREGYGPNPAAMRMLALEGAQLIVTVDCGTQSHAALLAARDAKADVIVCDHHQQAAQLPPAFAVVNPNILSDESGMGQLCAAGVAFLMAIAVNRELRQRGWFRPSRPEPDMMPLVGIVALATVADVVPLTGPNRALVVAGLKVLQDKPVAGLRALMQVGGVKGAPEPYHLGFILGPRVNAGGRVGNCGLGTDLLSTDDPEIAARIAAELDRLNRERQAIESLILEEALQLAEAQSAQGRRVIVLAREGWHAGVIGIVAGRIKDRVAKPAVVIGLEGGYGKGSARSVAGADIGAAMTAAKEAGLLLAGGGHAMAAGLTVTADKVEALSAFLEERLGAASAASSEGQALTLDGALSNGGLTLELAAQIAAAGPYGSGNPEPIFALPDQTIVFAKLAGQDHVRFVGQGPDGGRTAGIAFRSAETPLGQALLKSKGRSLHLAGVLNVSDWNGSRTVELRLQDAAFK